MLVNNAGVTGKSPVEVPGERAREIFETHVWGMVRMAGAVEPVAGSGVGAVIVGCGT